jgi:hypothetical protein
VHVRTSLVLTCLALAACSPRAASHDDGAPAAVARSTAGERVTEVVNPYSRLGIPMKDGKPDLTQIEIGLERWPCFGWCPAYTLTIAGDGRVAYHGTLFVVREGAATGTVARVAIENLLASFDAVNFFAFDDEKIWGTNDSSELELRLTVGGAHRRVWVQDAHRLGQKVSYPSKDMDDLFELARRIDAAVDVGQWIGTQEERHKRFEDRR